MNKKAFSFSLENMGWFILVVAVLLVLIVIAAMLSGTAAALWDKIASMLHIGA